MSENADNWKIYNRNKVFKKKGHCGNVSVAELLLVE